MSDDKSRSGEKYNTETIQEFVESVHSPHSNAHLNALEALLVHDMPRIQVAPTDGKILHTLMAMIQAKKVVEFGTLSGYSALWLLEGMHPGGHLWTVESEPEHAKVADDVFEEAGVFDRVTMIQKTGLEALEILDRQAPFDAVFIDADKPNYPKYARWAYDHLRPGGLIIGDNAYLFGYLAGKEPDEEWDIMGIEAMQEFHRFIAENMVSVCLPTPDGMAVALKM